MLIRALIQLVHQGFPERSLGGMFLIELMCPALATMWTAGAVAPQNCDVQAFYLRMLPYALM